MANAAWADAANEFRMSSDSGGEGDAKLPSNRIEWPEQFSDASNSSSGSSQSSGLSALGMGTLPKQGILNSNGVGTARGNLWNLQDRWPSKPGGTPEGATKIFASDAPQGQGDAQKSPSGAAAPAEDPPATKEKKKVISL
mmetsp:Transcript_122147/g.353170  ORF Transcript_122147/g.353170 Transcript_122147/m.353170 type:complete len:140 (+) Transcript_122147:92-511(+)